MKTLQTKSLLLRKFTTDDFNAVHSYASNRENIIYMMWGPNTEKDTQDYINIAISQSEEVPCLNYQYAAILQESGQLIGGCNLCISGDEGEIGWILHMDYWKQGYGTEMGKAMLQLGFDELSLHRILAHCNAENDGSYRVMEKIGMRREGFFIESRPASKNSTQKYDDELSYAILQDEWETQKEIDYYNTLPYTFDNFIDMPELSDGLIHLVCIGKNPALIERKWVPSYDFHICKGSEKIGEINLRIGYGGGLYNSNLYYGGQVGFGIDEKYRGNGYAVRACHLLLPVAKAHSIEKLLITNIHTNRASRRVCEKIGGRFLRVARLPEWHDLYIEGHRFVNVFEWSLI